MLCIKVRNGDTEKLKKSKNLAFQREIFKVEKYHRVMEVEVADSLASRRRVEANTGFR